MQRRSFLIGAAAASASAFGQGSNDAIGTGVIGTGNRGSHLTRGVLEQPGVRVIALCDIKADRLDKAATLAARDNPRTYSDYRALLENKDVQAVYIATPCHLHVEMAIAALEAGKHVYCEKPVGITAESIGRLVRAARRSNKVFQAGQQMRSMTRLRKTIEQIEQGVIGRVLMVKAQRNSSNDLAHDGPSADWFFKKNLSGEYLVEMSVHNLDLCNWVIGGRPERAAGFGGTLLYKNDPPGRDIMDGYNLTYEYPNEVKLAYMQLVFHPRGLPSGGQFTHVYGSKGAVDVTNSMFYALQGKEQPRELVPAEKEDQHAHTAAFYECIRTGKKPVADITVGATAALTAILGRESIYGKKVLEWRDLGVEL